jgi:VanZ family protein
LFLRYNIFSLFFFLLIVFGCFLPGTNLPKARVENLDKVLHITLFFLFSFSSIIGFIKQSQFPKLHFDAVKNVVGISTIMAFSTETIQHFFIARRSFDIWDIFADLIGITLAFSFFLLVRGNQKCGF